jgi:hypothetical protein
MVTPGFGEVIADYKVSLDQVSTYLVGVLILATGTGTFFTSAAATVWGPYGSNFDFSKAEEPSS